MARKLTIVVLAALLIPYVMTLAWTGRVREQAVTPLPVSGKLILLDRKSGDSYMDVEAYLPGVIAKQIPVTYGQEALRAQAIIARTYIYLKMNGADEVKESELNLEYYGEKDLRRLWGSEEFVDAYQKMEDAVGSTAGMVMTCEGSLIEPLFHRASTGKTRAGDERHPYLQAENCPKDLEADGYLTAITFSKEEFADKLNKLNPDASLSADQVPQAVQIVERDGSGYVTEIQVGTRGYTGEEVQYALGLPSSAYRIVEYEGGIRVISEGIGHGYGLSQYTAKLKAEEGQTAEEILAYFYKNIVLNSE